jgi:membrane protease YdiL (CAAX protease family)
MSLRSKPDVERAEAQGSRHRTREESSLPSLRGFGLAGLLAMLVIFLSSAFSTRAGAVLVLIWAWLSGTPWNEIGYVRPRNWPATLLVGVVVGVAFKFAMKAIVMPLLGADPVNHAYHFLSGNRAALPGMISTVLIGGGFAEETFYRGYLFERLGKLLGSSITARIAILVVTSLLFGAAHYHDQGLAGLEQGAITGFVFGVMLLGTTKIVLPMVAHAAFDLTAVWMIYSNLEAHIGHLIFH